MGGIKSIPANIEYSKTLSLEVAIADFPILYARYNELKAEGWKLFVVNQYRGRCYPYKKWITIPLWCLDIAESKWIQYVAHEFAHTKPHTRIPGTDDHGPAFMEEMKRLCPQEYWHHELSYKPKQASYAGISNEHKSKAKEIKLIDLLDLL